MYDYPCNDKVCVRNGMNLLYLPPRHSNPHGPNFHLQVLIAFADVRRNKHEKLVIILFFAKIRYM